MSSELECRTAIIVALRCGRAPKEIINFFKFPKATVYSIAKSFKESEDIEDGFLTPERKTPDRSQVRKRSADFIDRLQTMINDAPSVPMSTLAERLDVHRTTVLHAIHEDLRCNSYVLRVRQMLSDAMKKKRTKFPAGVHVLEVMFSEGDIMSPHIFAKGQNVNKEVYLDVMQTVVKPWMT
ncbi:Transposable element tcb2 transposase [Caligus rogercresseyi]|uniref:Transposable element tcb2 transposase n=1 Tax=Caligus rogercresseyi TaxID=217165 RepID=A0A7T8QWZ2_CALRO|nr:Transposable element tcb2 transposase [Caligus rogercresseyi]